MKYPLRMEEQEGELNARIKALLEMVNGGGWGENSSKLSQELKLALEEQPTAL